MAIKPYQNRSPWSLQLKSVDATVKVKRTQFPFVCAGASAEHVLQGSACDPGLVSQWEFPRRMGVKWLGIYVALSRVRRLASLKSIGMSEKIKAVVEQGPPDTIPAWFAAYF